MTENQIKHMVDRFLGWKLPPNFSPDNGISFDPIANKGHEFESRREPVGTNLLDVAQAEAMVRYMLEELPRASTLTEKEAGETYAEGFIQLPVQITHDMAAAAQEFLENSWLSHRTAEEPYDALWMAEWLHLWGVLQSKAPKPPISRARSASVTEARVSIPVEEFAARMDAQHPELMADARKEVRAWMRPGAAHGWTFEDHENGVVYVRAPSGKHVAIGYMAPGHKDCTDILRELIIAHLQDAFTTPPAHGEDQQ